MAPSSGDKGNKYDDWTLEELKSECTKRKLELDESSTKDYIIKLLIKDDNKSPDWGKIYSRVLYHTGMNYEEIARRTIPQIMAILDGAEENISIKIGMPNIFGGSSPLSPATQEESSQEESSQEDVESFFGSF